MGFAIEYDARNNILRVTLEGRVTDAILLAGYKAAAGCVASHPPFSAIVDFSGVTSFEVSSDTMRELARRPPAFPITYMRALVAPKDFVYGMTRMFQLIGEQARPNLSVVRTMDEAYRLLNVKSPEFGPIALEGTG